MPSDNRSQSQSVKKVKDAPSAEPSAKDEPPVAVPHAEDVTLLIGLVEASS